METWDPPDRAGDVELRRALAVTVSTSRCQIRDKLGWNRRPGLRRQISAPVELPERIYPKRSDRRSPPAAVVRDRIAEGDLPVRGPGCMLVSEQCSSQELPVTNDQINQTQQAKQ